MSHPAPVAPDVFAAAVELEQQTRAAFDALDVRYVAAQRALDAVSCNAVYTTDVQGPHYDEDPEDIVTVQAMCVLPRSHTGTHSERRLRAGAPAEYAAAVDAADAVNLTLGEAASRWLRAADALGEVACNHYPPGNWPCTARRGHDGDHEHPFDVHVLY